MLPLQNKVSVIHENIEGFRVDERSVPENNACIYYIIVLLCVLFVSIHGSTTPHNKLVKSKIIKEIVETPGCTYSEVEVTGI